MSDELRFDDRVAIITGAGGGLGRSYALLLAGRGAKIIVNDLGGSPHGEGANAGPADSIREAGGTAIANYDSVEDGDSIVQTALDEFGRIDILINNAGILRDVSFHKMQETDWDLIYRVHLYGSFKVTHAAWPHFREQQYGRVIMTASAAGIYGNFGQANYGTAKLGLLGLANTLAIEGKKRNIHVNTIAPIAGSRLTETVLPAELVAALKPDYVTPLVAYLCHERCDVTGSLFELGAGWISRLRWQRTQGAKFPLSQPMTPEGIAREWDKISDFNEATTPTTVQDAFGPIVANLKTADTTPGSEFVDLDKALGFEFEPTELSYDERDVSLYALSVGAATDPLDPEELKFTFEMNPDGFLALPTLAVTFPFASIGQILSVPGLRFEPMMLLHGEQYMELKRPLPTEATVTNHGKISKIYDKRSGALVLVDISSVDERGNEVAFNQFSLFLRGIGGFGGDRGPSGRINLPPDRPPDVVHRDKTTENQALLYRLSSGDRNPLHVDPSLAAVGGFDRPILHGLCTFGFAGRAVLKHFGDNDPTRFKSIKVRFTEHVYPGETIVTEMWRESPTRIVFRSSVAERNEVVLSRATVELFPAGEDADGQQAEAATGSAAAPKSLAIFEQIGERISEHPEWAKKVGAVFQFDITGSEGGSYVVDLKNDGGSARPGEDPTAGCKLTLSFDDFMAMISGELNPQMAFMGGKMKISGDVILAAKLAPLFS
jgi:3-hydroxyacyl-CoA dehydrogenase/3a,7a,12a-trihydroxy-5b-cholest-24-enoyl-CoA hydratase